MATGTNTAVTNAPPAPDSAEANRQLVDPKYAGAATWLSNNKFGAMGGIIMLLLGVLTGNPTMGFLAMFGGFAAGNVMADGKDSVLNSALGRKQDTNAPVQQPQATGQGVAQAVAPQATVPAPQVVPVLPQAANTMQGPTPMPSDPTDIKEANKLRKEQIDNFRANPFLSMRQVANNTYQIDTVSVEQHLFSKDKLVQRQYIGELDPYKPRLHISSANGKKVSFDVDIDPNHSINGYPSANSVVRQLDNNYSRSAASKEPDPAGFVQAPLPVMVVPALPRTFPNEPNWNNAIGQVGVGGFYPQGVSGGGSFPGIAPYNGCSPIVNLNPNNGPVGHVGGWKK